MTDVLPKIRVTDPNSQDKAANSPPPNSSSTADGSQLIRPTSSSSEGHPQNGAKVAPAPLTRNTSTRPGNASKPSSPQAERPPTAIDPLSHHILRRTNTENTIPQKLRNTGVPDSPSAEVSTPGSADLGASARHLEPTRSDTFPNKDKKKGVSFLSRFSIIGGKKKDQSDDADDDESELGDLRTEGMNAHVFSSSIGANGYIPQHKEPPRYIKVRAHNKKTREFNRIFLAQELAGSKAKPNGEKSPGVSTTEINSSRPASKAERNGGPIWATEFSKDGKYLAAGGQDTVVRVWSVISTPDERRNHEYEEDVSDDTDERLSAPVFRSKPFREFEGHTSVVLDLSWSKNNFLLSSSMDKTVRLWHVSREECLCTFKHKDFVTSIAFHPRDDRFFLAGSLDSVLRLWSIPDKSVAFWTQLPDLITAVAFTPDGKTAMAGVLSGLCMFYETEGLKYHTQIHVRSSRGKNAKGSKITGIRTTVYPPGDSNGEVKVLITSNDSRVRVYNFRDKTLEMKFKGLENTCSQIKASFSDDAKYIICGSEDRKAYIWSISNVDIDMKDKRPLEYFEAHSDMVTTAIMAPAKTRQLLGASGDPLYDLCNPPPVTLVSRAESNVSSQPPGQEDEEKRQSDPPSEPQVRKVEEMTPAYLARSLHPDGNIIITADHAGSIKVFRQDCAYQKRRNDIWETGSTFSKRVGTGMLGRSSSIMTRGSHSRRNSVSQSRHSSNAQLPSERILSWRNSVMTNASTDGVGSIRTSQTGRSDRSVSPGKISRDSVASIPFQSERHGSNTAQSTPNLASTARQQQYSGATAPSPSQNPSKPPSSTTTNNKNDNNPSQPPTPSFSLYSASDDNPLNLDSTGRSYQFWNIQTWRPSGLNNSNNANNNGTKDGSSNNASISDANSNPASNAPRKLSADLLALQKKTSTVSKLSSEEDLEREAGANGEEGTEEEEESEEGDALVCKRCGGKDFRAKKAVGRVGQRLVCTRCGLVAE